MKKVKNYLLVMVKYSPYEVVGIWVLDLFYSLIAIFTPMLMGLVIDDLANGEHRTFLLFISVLLVEALLGFLYRRYDTRTYEKIAAHFKEKYFSKGISLNIDTTEIDANTELIDEFSEFIRFFIIRISGMIGILFPLYYLYKETDNIVFYLAIVVSLAVLIIRFVYLKSMQKEISSIKDENEKRRDVIGKRDIFAYRSFLRQIIGFNIKYSDKDALSYLIFTILQLGLLIFSVFYIISNDTATAGVIFATITYIFELNKSTLDLPDLYSEYLSLKDNVKRIDI